MSFRWSFTHRKRSCIQLDAYYSVCCLIEWLELELVLDLVCGWLVVMHTYFYYFILASLNGALDYCFSPFS